MKNKGHENSEISSETVSTNSSTSEGSDRNEGNYNFNHNSEQATKNSEQSPFGVNEPLVNWSKYKTTHKLKEIIENIDHFLWICPSYEKDVLIFQNKLKEINLYEIILNHDSLKQFSLIKNREIYDYGLKYLKVDLKDKKTVKISYKLEHTSEINRARIDESNPDIFATKAGNGMVYIYSISRHNNNPVLTCRGHAKEGYGISWNPHRHGRLLSGSYDDRICIWDIKHAESHETDPIHKIDSHSGIVEDVQWCPNKANEFASVGDDRKLMIFDDRTCKPEISIEAHKKEVNSVAYHKKNSNFLITGSSDTTIRLWDLRRIKKHLHSFEAHDKPVYSVQWNPHNNNIFGSSGDDSRFHIWDINKIGVERKGGGLINQPTELILTNFGHKSSIRDFTWCPNLPWTISTVDDNKINQIWGVKKKIIYQDECLLDDEKIEI
ncbi:wd40 repeat family [Anaeramoeba flamelloides]|uniref:Wd40 repeat family n=1 Tax=Anaeramoeba flamelloides TaxID=1746091 RepID=A0ABQ8Y1X8_9EUKA|nr:wd40 repeat family [Anaeramoeba flamelloides]